MYLVSGLVTKAVMGIAFFSWKWAIISIRYWLATTSSMPLMPKHIFQEEQIVGQRFCGLIGVHITLLVDY